MACQGGRSEGGVGLPTSKFCSLAVLERGSKKSIDEPRDEHTLFICDRGRGKTVDSGCLSASVGPVTGFFRCL